MNKSIQHRSHQHGSNQSSDIRPLSIRTSWGWYPSLSTSAEVAQALDLRFARFEIEWNGSDEYLKMCRSSTQHTKASKLTWVFKWSTQFNRRKKVRTKRLRQHVNNLVSGQCDLSTAHSHCTSPAVYNSLPWHNAPQFRILSLLFPPESSQGCSVISRS